MIRVALSLFLALFLLSPAVAEERPNILWITLEDISPHVGCYGDEYAVTPNIDRLAGEGVLYTHAFATIGVCAPARSTIIFGMYPPSIGTQHMRCKGRLRDYLPAYSELLMKAGYYCTNNSKTDYNWDPPHKIWDASGGNAHWKNRPQDKPFFSIFNLTTCHESQIRLGEKQYQQRVNNFTPQELHDPAQATVPPYHPDTPEVRKDWARYADMITFTDKRVGELLAELKEAGLEDETIVFFYSDHGAGMPRSKRWLYDSSLWVPFIVRFPEKWRGMAPEGGKPGTKTDRLISFVDLAPTLLSLAGAEIPKEMQGEPFLGPQATQPRKYIYGFRDRMDERTDFIRCVRDQRYKYIRNFNPHRPWFHDQHISYMYQMPTMQVWQKLADEGKLTGPSAIFMARQKPVEELYDCQADPHEVNNLANDPRHTETLNRMRTELKKWQEEIIDLGYLPESQLRGYINGPEYGMVRKHSREYPLEKIMEVADMANQPAPYGNELARSLENEHPTIRYWGAVGMVTLGKEAKAYEEQLLKALEDEHLDVRITAAEALVNLGQTEKAMPVLREALGDSSPWIVLMAAQQLDRLGKAAAPALPELKAVNQGKTGLKESEYPKRVIEDILKRLS